MLIRRLNAAAISLYLFLCVQRCSIGGLFPLWFFDSKNNLCRYGIGLQTNSLSSHWFYEAIGFKMLTTDVRVFVNQGVLSTHVSFTSHWASKFLFDSGSNNNNNNNKEIKDQSNTFTFETYK